jgi:hypothetical protein
MAATAPARAKFTPAPMKRLTEVQKANPVARAFGAEQLRQPQAKDREVAAEHAEEEQHRHECR